MIVDTHCHVFEERLMSDESKKPLYGLAVRLKCPDSMIFDGSSERLIREMDEAGIDKAIILALDYELVFKGKMTYRDYNEYVADIVKKYPDRFIGFAGIDPRRGKEATGELERCVEELGLKGVKLWPLTGFYPDDQQFYPFYKRVEELEIPILCHTGTGPPHTYLKYNRPAFVDTVAVDFPEMKIIMAHIGDPWTNEAITVAAKNPNVFIDISAWEVTFKYASFALFQTLVTAKMRCGGVEKILFGTDWPLFTSILSLKEWVNGIKEMKLPPPMKFLGLPDFTEDEKNLILGGNAARILDL